MFNKHSQLLSGMAVCALLSACTSTPRASDSLPLDATGRTVALAESKDLLADLDTATEVPAASTAPLPSETITPLRGRGYSQVAGQPGATLGERRLLAIRAARIEAVRDLVEQVHGIFLRSRTQIAGGVVAEAVTTADVEGVMRGARTVSVTPKGNDAYEVVMELDPDTLAYMLRALTSGA